MTYDQIIEAFGGTEWGALTRASVALERPLSTLKNWQKRGVPLKAQMDIAARTRRWKKPLRVKR